MSAEERQLSDRERTVLLLAAEGLTDKEIAKHLNLSQRTIGTYWERMRQKLGPYSRTQLVARFLRFESEADRSSESYRSLFSTWEEGVWILSGSGHTIYANPPLASLLGVHMDDVLRSDPDELFRTTAGEELDGFLDETRAAPHSREFQLRNRDNLLWLRLRGFPVTDRRGATSALVLLLQDITVQRRVTHALDSCEASMALLADHCGNYIARFDQELVCTYANPALATALRLNADNLTGENLKETNLFQPNEEWAAQVSECLKTGERCEFHSLWQGKKLATVLIPEPTFGFLPTTVLSLTKRSSEEPS